MSIAPSPTAPFRITEPGFYDLPAAVYHADTAASPSLSSSIARTLISATPAHAFVQHPRLNPGRENDSSSAMEMGSVIHELVLGKGGGFDVLPFEDYRTKAAKEARDAAIALGKSPILEHKYQDARKVAESIIARVEMIDGCEELFKPDYGHPEVAMFWRDTGDVWCRTMIDWQDGHGIVTDLKTTGRGLDDRTLLAMIGDGLDVQLGHTLRGLSILRPETIGRIRWRWCFVETEEPFEVRIVEADGATMTMGAKKAAYAVESWRRCIDTGNWPGYPARIERLSYPQWAENKWIEREMNDPICVTASPIIPPDNRPAPKLVGAC